MKAVLTITGSDSCGGAGIQADIRTISQLGGYALTAITSITVQNTLGIQNYYDLPPETVRGQVEAVINGVAQPKSAAVTPWAHQYLEIPMQPVKNRSNKDVTSGYSLNDCSVADVDGDGQMEIVVKRRNDSGNLTSSSNKTDFNLHECYKMDGTRQWWIDMGPNLMSGPDEQFDLILCDWDRDGKAEAVMRGADNMIIHTKSGKAIKIGNMNYYAPRDEYTHEGAEYLLYLNGETGEPYGWDGVSDTFTPMAYPLPRFESGETNYATVWGKADTGHRSAKHFFGAPYLDGRNPSIFLGRGCYTRHKFCALDVNKETHELTQRWRWNCYDGNSPWFGNGFHNFAIADVDMDGRDEIVFGSMMIDDTGYGLSTTGFGHGDAQHCGDLDPYRWGLEQFVCLEGSTVPGIAYTDATTSTLRYTTGGGSDNGRCMAGNFYHNIPGAIGVSGGAGISLVADKASNHTGFSDDHVNMRVYWDGDLLDEFMDSPGTEKSPCVYKAPGQNDYNIYIQVNYGIHPVYITKQESKCGGCVLGNYQYSRGNLDPIGIAVNANGVLATNLGLGGLTIDADTTVADFSQAIMQNNHGYEALDQITFFYGEQYVDSEGVPRATMASERVVLSLTDQTKLWDVTSALGFSTVSGCLGMNTALSNAGGSWIHSRDLDDGSTQVSTQRMTVVSDILSHYQSDAAFLASANSYGGINKKSIYLSPSSNV